MPRLLFIYLIKRVALAAFVVESALCVPVVLSYLLGQLPAAAVRGGLVWPAIVGVTPTVAYVALPMAVGVATAMTFASMASESLISVLYALRLSVWAICRPTLVLALASVGAGLALAGGGSVLAQIAEVLAAHALGGCVARNFVGTAVVHKNREVHLCLAAQFFDKSVHFTDAVGIPCHNRKFRFQRRHRILLLGQMIRSPALLASEAMWASADDRKIATDQYSNTTPVCMLNAGTVIFANPFSCANASVSPSGIMRTLVMCCGTRASSVTEEIVGKSSITLQSPRCKAGL